VYAGLSRRQGAVPSRGHIDGADRDIRGIEIWKLEPAHGWKYGLFFVLAGGGSIGEERFAVERAEGAQDVECLLGEVYTAT